jgi:hypothetical protein
MTTHCVPLPMIFLKGGCSLSCKWFYLYLYLLYLCVQILVT